MLMFFICQIRDVVESGKNFAFDHISKAVDRASNIKAIHHCFFLASIHRSLLPSYKFSITKVLAQA